MAPFSMLDPCQLDCLLLCNTFKSCTSPYGLPITYMPEMTTINLVTECLVMGAAFITHSFPMVQVVESVDDFKEDWFLLKPGMQHLLLAVQLH